MSSERLALLAHELRSPVAALVALAERAAARDVPRDVLLQMVGLAIVAVHDVERLLSDPDVLSLRPTRVEIGALLRDVTRAGVTVAAERVEVVGDPTRLRQALRNLVDNGLRHGSHVAIAARPLGAVLVVDVTDDGPGVPDGLDVFARGESGAGSTGYGLWLARAIAEAHGGSLELRHDAVAGGAGFRLSLPLSGAATG